MKIFGLMAVKNEEDIVADTLQAAAQWCDAIFVLDNGSDDGTWQVIQQLAKRNRKIVPHGQSFEPFTEFIRASLFNAYRKQAQEGDWWCRLDGDEIYVHSPRDFLRKVTSHQVVWAIQLQYYFTKQDLELYEQDAASFGTSVPLTQRYRYYLAEHSEPRFFRHRDRLRWEAGAWPRHLGRVFPERILLRHYKFRTPGQIRTRLSTRSAIFARGGFAGGHWRNTDWTRVIRDCSEFEYDNGDGKFVVDEKLLPRHRDPFWKATIKNLMHGMRVWP
jgi:glycosyltransferase involved in cell wall biosynthesis